MRRWPMSGRRNPVRGRLGSRYHWLFTPPGSSPPIGYPPVLIAQAPPWQTCYMSINSSLRGEAGGSEAGVISGIIEDLKAYRRPIDSNPLFARLAGGEITRFHYLAAGEARKQGIQIGRGHG